MILKKPIKTKNNFSKAYSLEFVTKSHKSLKFIFNRDLPLKDWYKYIDTAIDLMVEHYHKENNKLQRMMEKIEQPIKYPLHFVYNKRKKQWEPFIRPKPKIR